MTELPKVFENYLNEGFKKAWEYFEEVKKMDRKESFEIVKGEYFREMPRIFEDFRRDTPDMPEDTEEASRKFLEIYEQYPTCRFPAIDILIKNLIKEIETAFEFYKNLSRVRD